PRLGAKARRCRPPERQLPTFRPSITALTPGRDYPIAAAFPGGNTSAVPPHDHRNHIRAQRPHAAARRSTNSRPSGARTRGRSSNRRRTQALFGAPTAGGPALDHHFDVRQRPPRVAVLRHPTTPAVLPLDRRVDAGAAAAAAAAAAADGNTLGYPMAPPDFAA